MSIGRKSDMRKTELYLGNRKESRARAVKAIEGRMGDIFGAGVNNKVNNSTNTGIEKTPKAVIG